MTSWLCSADADVLEPGDLWLERLPTALRHRAPTIEFEDGFRIYGVEGQRLRKIPNAIDYVAVNTPVPADVEARLAMLDEDGVWAESIIGSLASSVLMGIEEPALSIASARVYNDYLIETFGPYRNREPVIALIPPIDIRLALEELERVAARGVAGITMPICPLEPYYLDRYEPLWAAVCEYGLPVSFHSGTGPRAKKTSGEAANVAAASPDPRIRAALKCASATMNADAAFQVTAWLVGGGVFEHHPDLQVLFVETGAGWLAFAMETLDFRWRTTPGQDRVAGLALERLGAEGNESVVSIADVLGGKWPYPLAPSDYVRRQVHATFQDEPGAIKFLGFTGAEPLLWGSDFPHPEGTWPRSRQVVDELLAGIDVADQRAISGGTFAKLYGITVPSG